MNNSEDIRLKPSSIFAFFKILPTIIRVMVLAWVANRYYPPLIWLSLFIMIFGIYRYIFIRQVIYVVTPQYIRITKGLFLKQIDTVELFRIKDYTITEPFLFQVFKLMDVHLKTTDPENPMLWLRGIPQSNLIDIIRERVLTSRQHNRIYEIN